MKKTIAQQSNELISQADAARLRGVTRQRIEQLINAGRLTPYTVTSFGRKKIRLDRKQVINLKEGTRGRPRLSDEEKDSRAILRGYEVGQLVYYSQWFKSIALTVEAKIVKIGKKRLRIEYLNDQEEPEQAWVRPDTITHPMTVNNGAGE